MGVINSGIAELHAIDGFKPHSHKIRKHAAKARVGRELASLPHVATFAFVSDKAELGYYGENLQLKKNGVKGYQRLNDKCLQFLLEQVGQFLEEHSFDESEIHIVVEEAKNIDYLETMRFLTLCRDSPNYGTAHLLRDLPVDRIAPLDKEAAPALFFADYVAHSVYKCFDIGPSTAGLGETRYAEEILVNCYRSQTGPHQGVRLSSTRRLDKLAEREREIVKRFSLSET